MKQGKFSNGTHNKTQTAFVHLLWFINNHNRLLWIVFNNRNMPPDERKVVGGRVHAKAHFIMHESDAKHWYGTLWNTTLIAGTVVRLDEKTTANGVRQTLVVADWELTGGRIR